MSYSITNPLTFAPKDEDKKFWMTLPMDAEHSMFDSYLLIYSNEETFENYLD